MGMGTVDLDPDRTSSRPVLVDLLLETITSALAPSWQAISTGGEAILGNMLVGPDAARASTSSRANTSLPSRSAATEKRAIAQILTINHSDGAEERGASKEDQPSSPAQPPRRRW
jgi:hypothetical protein